jgi:hypothetical protein
MSDSSRAIVPKITDYPGRKEKASEIIDWLVAEDIIKGELSDCILSKYHGYAISAGAKYVVKEPQYLPFDLITNGLELVTEPTVLNYGEITGEEDEDFQPEENNLGFIFWNWPEFTDEFIQHFKTKLGCEVDIIFERL